MNQSSIEAEIAELSQKIEEKRKLLESSKGIVEERELVRAAIAEKINPSMPQPTLQATTQVQKVVKAAALSTGGKSYLDTLDPESRQIVEELVAAVFVNGISKTLEALKDQEPYIIDAFHDVLTDKIYDELQKRKIIK